MADTVDLGGVWTAATDELADEIVSAQQRAYLRLTRLRAIVEDTALLSVPDAFTRDVIESRLRPAITDALSRRLGRPIQVAVTVRPPEDGSGRPGTVYGVQPPEDERAARRSVRPADHSTTPQYAQPPRRTATSSRPAPLSTRRRPPRTPGVPAARDAQDALFAAPIPQAPMPQAPAPGRHRSRCRAPQQPLAETEAERSGRRMATDPAQLRENQVHPDRPARRRPCG